MTVDPTRILPSPTCGEVFALEIGRIDPVGPCSRITFCVPMTVILDDSPGNRGYSTAVVELIVPTEALPEMARRLATADMVQCSGAPILKLIN